MKINPLFRPVYVFCVYKRQLYISNVLFSLLLILFYIYYSISIGVISGTIQTEILIKYWKGITSFSELNSSVSEHSSVFQENSFSCI